MPLKKLKLINFSLSFLFLKHLQMQHFTKLLLDEKNNTKTSACNPLVTLDKLPRFGCYDLERFTYLLGKRCV